MTTSARIPLALASLALFAACASTVAPPAKPVSTTPPKPLTAAVASEARAFLDTATAEAKKVAPDAQLIRVDSQRGPDFEAHIPADGKVPHWLYSYRSKKDGKEINITASSLEVKKINESVAVIADEAVLPSDWMDSAAIFESAQKNGGSAYATASPGMPVYYSLGYDIEQKKPTWTVRYSVNPKNGLYYLVLDAVSGEFLDKKETKPDASAV